MNPYEVLGIKHDATAHEIVQAVALALRERKYSAREVAGARKQLMDPQARMILDFVHCVDIVSLLNPGKENSSGDSAIPLLEGVEGLKRLTIFDMQR